MAKFFIDRPIFAIALSLIIVFAGLIAGFSLPIAQYPNITKPQIEVSTTYVGANATTVEESIAQAIEQKVNGVENMRDMRSTSTNTGGYTLNVTFNLEKTGILLLLRCKTVWTRRNLLCLPKFPALV